VLPRCSISWRPHSGRLRASIPQACSVRQERLQTATDLPQGEGSEMHSVLLPMDVWNAVIQGMAESRPNMHWCKSLEREAVLRAGEQTPPPAA